MLLAHTQGECWVSDILGAFVLDVCCVSDLPGEYSFSFAFCVCVPCEPGGVQHQ